MVLRNPLSALIAVVALATSASSESLDAAPYPPAYVLHDLLLLRNAFIRGDVSLNQLNALVETGRLGPRDFERFSGLAAVSRVREPKDSPDGKSRKNVASDHSTALKSVQSDAMCHSRLRHRTLETLTYDLKFAEPNIVGDSQFGRSVSMAGDMNGDGYDDIIVGAYAYYNASGRSYLYFGGSAPDSIPDITLEAENVLDLFGMAVAGAGDVNGDEYDDVIVGAPGHGGNVGRSYVYFGASEMDIHADLVLDGEDMDDGFGVTVAGAGDLNGDGYDDIAVGATGHNTNTGRVYVYFGGEDMDPHVDIILDGEETWNIFGISVAASGDVNHDGYDDVTVGAPWYGSGTGRAYVFLGDAQMDSEADVVIDGETQGDSFGYATAGLEDTNGDGCGDLVVGAPGYNGQVGRSYVYYGGRTMDTLADMIYDGEGGSFGYSCTASGDVNGDGNVDVVVAAPWLNGSTGRAYVFYGGDNLRRTADVTIDGEGEESYFGMSLSSAGDVADDGFDDLHVGLPGFGDATGRSHLYYGAMAMDSVVDLVIEGEGTLNRFGTSVAGSADVNGDGYDDIVVGATGRHSYDGRVYVYFGDDSMDSEFDVMLEGFGSQVAAAGDVNGDGCDDILVGFSGCDDYTGQASLFFGGSSIDDVVDVTFAGEAPDNYFGWSVARAGDVNNDGFDDVIVGAIWHNGYRGRVYIYFGSNNMDEIPNVILNGEAVWDELGWSVAGAGDVNNDGYDDIIVGARGWNEHTGRAIIYFGGSSMDAVADVVLEGESIDDFFGSAVSGAGDLNGDGYDDVIVGTYRCNDETGRAYIYFGGDGMDSIVDVLLDGESAGDEFGISVAGVGDVNEDGFDDVIVGADGHNSFTGRSYVYFGSDNMDAVADFVIDGEGMWNEFGCAVGKAGDVNGEGRHDIMVGALHHPANGAAYVFFGEPLCIEYQWEIPLGLRSTRIHGLVGVRPTETMR